MSDTQITRRFTNGAAIIDKYDSHKGILMLGASYLTDKESR